MSCGVSCPFFPAVLSPCTPLGKTFKRVFPALHVFGGLCICGYCGLLSFPVKMPFFFNLEEKRNRNSNVFLLCPKDIHVYASFGGSVDSDQAWPNSAIVQDSLLTVQTVV